MPAALPRGGTVALRRAAIQQQRLPGAEYHMAFPLLDQPCTPECKTEGSFLYRCGRWKSAVGRKIPLPRCSNRAVPALLRWGWCASKRFPGSHPCCRSAFSDSSLSVFSIAHQPLPCKSRLFTKNASPLRMESAASWGYTGSSQSYTGGALCTKTILPSTLARPAGGTLRDGWRTAFSAPRKCTVFPIASGGWTVIWNGTSTACSST